MFNEKNYIKYIKILENIISFKYIFFVLICMFGGGILCIKVLNINPPIIGFAVGGLLAIIIYYFYFIKEQIKVEKLKMELEIYQKIKAEK